MPAAQSGNSARKNVIALTGCLILAAAAAHPAFADEAHTFRIAAADASVAVREFAQQSGVQIMASASSLEGKKLNPVTGEHTTEDALHILLADTGLKHQYAGERGVVIAPAMDKDEDQRAASEAQDAQKGPLQLDEVVVTGSHIRGSEAAGSKVIVIDRQAIEASGHGRIEDVLENLTQNFRGVSESYNQLSVSNMNYGTSVQLRGLGPGTTLTLVNGRRQAVGGMKGAFVDISSIAASAVERIEILPDGASALYGSDAVGGVVNIILRKDFTGLESRVRASSAGGEARERQFAQLWGSEWSKGHSLIGYQYSDRDPLQASAREYSAANYDLRRFGGSDLRTPGGNPGTLTLAGQRYAIPAGQDGTQLTLAQLTPGTVNYSDNVNNRSLLPAQKLHAAFLSASYDVNARWVLSADGRYSTRDFEITQPQTAASVTVPVANAFNRFGVPVSVAYDFTRDLGPYRQHGTTETAFASMGITGALPGAWHVDMSGAYAKEGNAFHWDRLNTAALAPYLNSADPAIALNVFGEGSHTSATTLNALYRHDYERGMWTTSSVSVIADGPLFSVPAGAVRLAAGGDYRKEHLTYRVPSEAVRRSADRDVSAAFLELAVPLLGSGEKSGPGRVELSLAGRYESYSDFGNTFDPKAGLTVRPLDFIKLRGTWGTSFRAPGFYQANPDFNRSAGFATDVPDRQSTAPNGRSRVLAVSGAYQGIKEETADVWTAGADIQLMDGLSFSMTYFDIHYQGKIQGPGSASQFLVQEQQFAPVVTRNPTQAQIDAICNDPGFVGSCNGPFVAILDGRTRNLSAVKTRGVDGDLTYSLPTPHGRWVAGLRGTYTIDYQTRLLDTSPTFEVVDTVNNPLALRLSGRLSWSQRAWVIQTSVNHDGSYQDPGASSGRRVDSWTTVDLNIGYRIEANHGWLDDTQINLGAINLFDEAPPFIDNALQFGYDTANATVLGRQISLQLVKGW